ncbi:hypothetical protein FOL47_002673, partial [Perkinsus chesapeaki]
MGRSTVVFQEAVTSVDADAIAIQEPPRLEQCRNILAAESHGWQLVSARSPCRSAILIRKSISFRVVKGLEACRDWTAIDIDCCGTRYPTLRLVSGYCPSDGRITMEDCLEGLNFNFITGHHVILCCDSNAWNNSWGTPPDGGSYQRRRT